MCVNEKKVQDPGSNPEPGARGVANLTERNGHPKTHPPNPRVGHPRCDSILLPSELQEWDADQQCVHQNQESNAVQATRRQPGTIVVARHRNH